MRSHNWDRGALLSMRTMSFPSSFPYDTITVPVHIIIGEDDTFLLKTAKEVRSSFCLYLSPDLLSRSVPEEQTFMNQRDPRMA